MGDLRKLVCMTCQSISASRHHCSCLFVVHTSKKTMRARTIELEISECKQEDDDKCSEALVALQYVVQYFFLHKVLLTHFLAIVYFGTPCVEICGCTWKQEGGVFAQIPSSFINRKKIPRIPAIDNENGGGDLLLHASFLCSRHVTIFPDRFVGIIESEGITLVFVFIFHPSLWP